MKVIGLIVLIIVCIMFGYSLNNPPQFTQKVNAFFYDPKKVKNYEDTDAVISEISEVVRLNIFRIVSNPLRVRSGVISINL